MATELNFTARLDTSQFLSQVDQARTQFGLAFGPMGMGAGPGGVGGMISSQFQQMFAGMGAPSLGGGGFGQTFTNPAMAYTPFYGAIQANTSLQQEWLVNRYGLEAAQRMKPPGVSATDYALGVEKNSIQRQLDATHDANMAARSGFASGVGGLVGGELAGAIATPLGAMAGGALATRLLGAGAAGAGSMVGRLAAGYFAYNAASEFVGGQIEKHFARIEQIGGATRELGEIAGSGRNMNRSARYELGVAARSAAGDLKMDVNEMGDILALGRQNGMLPPGTDPSKAREQYREFARSIEEGAQILGTSLASATQVIKTATASGMTAQEGVIRAAGAGGAEAWMQQMAFGAAGAGVGRGMGFTGAQGAGVFMGALGAVGTGGLTGRGGGAGMTGEEIQIMGGHYAAAQFLGTTEMAMAKGPMGNLQMMAAMGGGNMGGTGLMDLPGAAMSGLMSGGDDFLSNMGKFTVHQNEMRRGIGASGIRTMTKAQLTMGGEMISQFMPDMSANEAQRMYAQSMGLDPDQAKLLVGGVHSGGGTGMGGGAQMMAIAAMQGAGLNVAGPIAPDHGGISFGRAAAWGAGGAVIGGSGGMGIGAIPGAMIGAVGGFVSENWGHLKSFGRDVFSGDIFDSAQSVADRDQRSMAAEYDKRLGAAKSRMGYLEIDQAAGQRFLGTNLRGARLDLDAVGSPNASYRTYGMMAAMGLGGGPAGAGTVMMGGHEVDATAMQTMAGGNLWDAPVTEKAMASTMAFAHSAAYGTNLDQKRFQEYSLQARMNWQTVLHGETPKGLFGTAAVGVMNAGENLIPSVQRLINGGQDGATKARLLAKIGKPGGVNDPEVRAFLEQATGSKFEGLGGAFMAGRGGAAAMKATEDMTMGAEANFLAQAYGERRNAAPDAEDVMGDFFSGRDITGGRDTSFYTTLQRNKHYLAAKEASLGGHNDQAKKLIQQAEMETQIEGGDKYRTAGLPMIDPSATIHRPGSLEGSSALFVAAQTLRNINAAAGVSSTAPSATNAALIKLDRAASAQAQEMTTWAQQVKNEKVTGMAEHNKRAQLPGPGMVEHAVGFGEQESAMASINKSLKSTERTLSVLEKRVAGMASSPQTSNTPQIPAGGKP